MCTLIPTVRVFLHVSPEFLAEFGLAVLNLRKACFGIAHQLGTRQHEIAQGVFQRLLLCRIELVTVHGAVLGEQALISTQSGPEVGDAGQRLVVGGTQFRRVCHGIQVADDAPGAAQLLGGHISPRGSKLQLENPVLLITPSTLYLSARLDKSRTRGNDATE